MAHTFSRFGFNVGLQTLGDLEAVLKVLKCSRVVGHLAVEQSVIHQMQNAVLEVLIHMEVGYQYCVRIEEDSHAVPLSS